MRALVTGAAGFVGSYLVSYLHQKGFEVWASFHKNSRTFPFPVHWIQSDLTCTEETLALVRKSRPDYVFHLAAYARPAMSWKGPEETIRTNVSSSVFLLEGMTRFAPKARGIFVSTGQVYGGAFLNKKQVKESDTANPVAPYAGSKLLMEMAALQFIKSCRLKIVIARAFNQIGTGQPSGFVFPDFCRQVALIEKRKMEPAIHVGNVDVVRDFIHVEDGVRAYLTLARHATAGNIYNVGGGRGISLKNILQHLKRKAKIPFEIKKVDSLYSKDSIPRAVSDSSKLRKLGWRPERSVWRGLEEVLEEWRKKVG